MRSGLKDVDTAKTNTAVPKGTARPVDKAQPKPYKFAHKSRAKRSFDRNPSKNFSYYKKYVYTLNEKVDTGSEKVDIVNDKSDTAGENAIKGDKGNAVKSSPGCVVRPDQDVID